MYRLLYWLVLSRLPAELMHNIGFVALRAFAAIPGIKLLLRRLCQTSDPSLEVHALGLTFPSPLGLAAGFDKNAVGFEALGALGFGFVEIGTVTGQPQLGNPKPRMFRLREDRAIVNRMGFNNAGSLEAAKRLARRKPEQNRLIVGANIGKTKCVDEVDAIADYVLSAKRLAPVADYLVVNVSSPNTPGLRDLQAVSKLDPLLRAVRNTLDQVSPTHRVPLLVKIAPDLSDEDIDAVADLALTLGLDGIIATNTTIARTDLHCQPSEIETIGAGGLSGAPLKQRSLAVLHRLRNRVGNKLVLISAGGIESAEDAIQRLNAGATLIQAYTAFIYFGPGWPRKLTRQLKQELEKNSSHSQTVHQGN